jgi:hypothetical protein
VTGQDEAVLPLVIWALAAILLVAGGLLLKAGRDLDTARSDDEAEVGAVAALVDQRLQRTREAVDVLIQPDVHPDEVRPTESAMHNRAQTYLVLGGGLVGIAVLMTLGVLLLVSG